MAAKYFRNVTGNYSADTSWSTTTGGANDTTKPTSADDVHFDANSGACTIDAASVAKTIDCTGYTNTLTHNAFVLTVSGSVTLVSGMTYTPDVNATLTINATATLTTGGKLLAKANHTSGTLTLGDNLSFMADKGTSFTLSGTAVDLNGKTISGNSVTNRVFIKSATLGTGKQITVNSGTFANADFQDITFSTGSNLDLSAITGKSGDCGGNTITGGGSTLTFTAPATQTATGTSAFTWSTHGWTSRVPLPQDNVVINNAFSASQNVTVDMPRAGKSIDFTGATGNPGFVAGLDFSVYGSLTLASGMGMGGVFTIGLFGRSSYTITNANTSWASGINIQAIGGTYQLVDNFSTGSSITLTNGTLDMNGKNATCSNFLTNFTNTRAITNPTGTLTLTTAPTIWQINTSGLTFNPSALSIVINNAGGNARTFNMAGLTFAALTYTAAGGALTLSGGGTITTLTVSSSTTKTLKVTNGTTLTVTNFNVAGASGRVLTFSSDSGGAFFTLSVAAGVVSTDYLSIQDSHATGGATFYAGANSTNVSGNSGWTFTAPPSTGTKTFGDEGMVS